MRAQQQAGQLGGGAGKKRSARAEHEAPKPSQNAYLHFSAARRSEVGAMYADWTVQQVSAEVGRQWKALSQLERKPWIELAQFDKARFQTELEQYLEKRRTEEVVAPLKRKKSKNQPKQPDTAYICYWKSKRLELLSENPDMESTLVSKEVGRHWKALSEEERQVRFVLLSLCSMNSCHHHLMSVCDDMTCADLEGHVCAGQAAISAGDC